MAWGGRAPNYRPVFTWHNNTDDTHQTFTHITPLAEMFGGVPLEFLVPLVAHYGRSAPGQPSLGDIYMVALHPLGPVAPITAVDKTSTFEKEGGTGHNRRFLKGIRTTTMTPDVVMMEQSHFRTTENKHTRSRAAARMDASGMVPGSQQFSRNWKRFIP